MSAGYQPAPGVPRDAVCISGSGAGAYLQSQATQDLAQLAIGSCVWTFFLRPNGRIEVLARVTRAAEDSFVVDTDAGFGDVLEARLRRFFIRVEALIARCDSNGAADDPAGGDTGVDTDDDEAARVAAGWPAMGREIIPGEVIPAETGIVAVTVDFRKGCYPGQELVERMDSRGASAPRQLRVVRAAAVPAGLVPTSVAGDLALVYVPRS